MTAGQQAGSIHVVTESDTAAALGSGDLDVLATPRLIAWLEAATCDAVRATLGRDETSVGTRVAVEHLKASPVGATVQTTATVQYVDGRLLRFEVVATGPDGTVLAHGEITRVRVDRQRFLARLAGPPPP